jgi:hypothetical protein
MAQDVAQLAGLHAPQWMLGAYDLDSFNALDTAFNDTFNRCGARKQLLIQTWPENWLSLHLLTGIWGLQMSQRTAL